MWQHTMNEQVSFSWQPPWEKTKSVASVGQESETSPLKDRPQN